MAIPRNLLSEQPIVDFKTKCADWLQTAEQQKVLAMEMIKQTRQMCGYAAEMTKQPNPPLRWRARLRN
jgi:hypothetical protein